MTTLDELGSLDNPTRYPATDRLFTLLDKGRVTPGQVIDMLVNCLSEDELADRLFTLLDEERMTPGQVIDKLVNDLSEDELAEMLDMNKLDA